MSAQTPQTDNPETGYRSHYAEHEHNRELCRALEADRDHYKALCEELRLALERTAYALELAFSKKPLRDMAETLAEARAALKKAQKP